MGATKYYLYDNEDIIAEYDSAGSLTASYVHGQGIDEPISMTRGGNTYYYTFDGLGSVFELTDNSESVVESYKYDAFGNVTIFDSSLVPRPSSLVNNPYTYTSREYDSETGLYYYRARYYDASVGRFLTEDPILKVFRSQSGFVYMLPLLMLKSQLLNPYIYAYNNPITKYDPYGLYTQKPGCDVINLIPLIGELIDKDPCFRACCDEHDACFEKYKCRVISWLTCQPFKCAICNIKVTLCFTECIIIYPLPAY